MSKNDYWILKSITGIKQQNKVYFSGYIVGRYIFSNHKGLAKIFDSYEQADYKRQSIEAYYDLKPGTIKIIKKHFKI